MRTAIICTLLALAGVARAQSADAEFDRGVELKKVGNFAAALEAFQRSEAMDPQSGTEYNIALCQSELKQPVEALQALRRLVKEDALPDRRKKEAELLAR